MSIIKVVKVEDPQGTRVKVNVGEQGLRGVQGPASIDLGTVTVVNPDQDPSLVNAGTPEDVVLDVSLPRASAVTVGQVSTGQPSDPAVVSNVGADGDVVLDFVIPQGEKGEKGDKGDQGAAGLEDAPIPGGPQGELLALDGQGGLEGVPSDAYVTPDDLRLSRLIADFELGQDVRSVLAWDDFRRDGLSTGDPLGAAPKGGTWQNETDAIVAFNLLNRAVRGVGGGNTAIATLDGDTYTAVDITAVVRQSLNLSNGVFARYIDEDNHILFTTSRGTAAGDLPSSRLRVRVGGTVTTDITYTHPHDDTSGTVDTSMRLLVANSQVWGYVYGHRVVQHTLTSPERSSLTDGRIGIGVEAVSDNSGSHASMSSFVARRIG